jgi:hypothetical protein
MPLPRREPDQSYRIRRVGSTGVRGLFKISWRFGTGRAGQTLWAPKPTALACQNLIMPLQVADCDSGAIEGFDEPESIGHFAITDGPLLESGR